MTRNFNNYKQTLFRFLKEFNCYEKCRNLGRLTNQGMNGTLEINAAIRVLRGFNEDFIHILDYYWNAKYVGEKKEGLVKDLYGTLPLGIPKDKITYEMIEKYDTILPNS